MDYLLESMIFSAESFRALVIIDELVEELETLLISRFKFPVEVLTLERYKAGKEVAYRFRALLVRRGQRRHVQRQGYRPGRNRHHCGASAGRWLSSRRS